jgi:hypothetical protein
MHLIAEITVAGVIVVAIGAVLGVSVGTAIKRASLRRRRPD